MCVWGVMSMYTPKTYDDIRYETQYMHTNTPHTNTPQMHTNTPQMHNLHAEVYDVDAFLETGLPEHKKWIERTDVYFQKPKYDNPDKVPDPNNPNATLIPDDKACMRKFQAHMQIVVPKMRNSDVALLYGTPYIKTVGYGKRRSKKDSLLKNIITLVCFKEAEN